MARLDELGLDRNLYKTPLEGDSWDAQIIAMANDSNPIDPIATGNAATDVNNGSVQLNGEVIAPGTIPPSTLDIANFGWTQTCAFSVVDSDTVIWGSGTFTSADGVNNLAISAGTTGNMAGTTYVYLDINVSTTAYQLTTSITGPIGIGKVLIAVCKTGSPGATYNLVQASQIVSDNILANTIIAQKMNVAILSAITADLGTINAGSVTGITITGSLFRTATTGQRIEITSSPTNLINFYDTSTLYGQLEVTNSGSEGVINLTSVDGGGLHINTGVGTTGHSETEIEASGFSFDVSGNGSVGAATMTGINGGQFYLFGDSGGDTLFTTVDFLPDTDGVYKFGGPSAQWDSVYTQGLFVTQIALFTGQVSRSGILEPVTYHGYCSGTTISKNNASFVLTNPSTGNYTITHNLATTNYTIQVTALRASGTGAYIAKVAALASNSFDVIVFDDSGTSVNSDFMFLLLKN